MHDAYCKELSFKIRQSYNSKMQKGEFLTGSPPFGFVKSAKGNRLEIDDEAAETVRRIFSLACEGNKPSQIAIFLNESKTDTPLMYRKHKGRTLRGNHSAANERVTWNSTTIRKILVDERYMGVMVGGKQRIANPGSRKIQYLPAGEWIRIPNAHEPIVSEVIFKQANSGLMRSKRMSPTQKRSLFAGKIKCGHGCFEGRLGLDELKDVVLGAVKQEAQKVFDTWRAHKQSSTSLSSSPSSEQVIVSEIKQLAYQIALLEQRNITLFENFADGKVDRDDYISAKAVNVAEVEKVNGRIEALNQRLALVKIEADTNSS